MSEPATRNPRTSIWWNPFTVERIRLRTSLSPDECIQHIGARIYSFWRGADPALPFVGTTSRARFTLYRNPTRVSRNGTPYHLSNRFSPIAHGVLVPGAAEGTLIDIRLSLHTFVRIWWSLLLLSFTGAFVLSVLDAAGIVAISPEMSHPLLVLAISIVVFCPFYAFYVSAFWFVRRQRAFLVETLQTILQASVSPEVS